MTAPRTQDAHQRPSGNPHQHYGQDSNNSDPTLHGRCPRASSDPYPPRKTCRPRSVRTGTGDKGIRRDAVHQGSLQTRATIFSRANLRPRLPQSVVSPGGTESVGRGDPIGSGARPYEKDTFRLPLRKTTPVHRDSLLGESRWREPGRSRSRPAGLLACCRGFLSERGMLISQPRSNPTRR